MTQNSEIVKEKKGMKLKLLYCQRTQQIKQEDKWQSGKKSTLCITKIWLLLIYQEWVQINKKKTNDLIGPSAKNLNCFTERETWMFWNVYENMFHFTGSERNTCEKLKETYSFPALRLSRELYSWQGCELARFGRLAHGNVHRHNLIYEDRKCHGTTTSNSTLMHLFVTCKITDVQEHLVLACL